MEDLDNKILDGKAYLAKREALEVGKYYYKGFSNMLQTIISKADNHIINPGNDKYMIDSYAIYAGIQRHYNKIPFEELSGKERFYPLFIVRDLLPIFHGKMDEVFKLNKEKSIEDLERNSIAIAAVGTLYYETLKKVVANARSHPGLENFTLELKVWDESTFIFDPRD
jgi:hypothetical protein